MKYRISDVLKNHVVRALLLILLLSNFLVYVSEAQERKNSIARIFEQYNVKWTSQSANSSESMPLGGGDVGCNVWMENGELMMYLSQSGAFDENNQFLKLGRIRIQLEPNIFAEPDCEFSQELKLYDGYVEVKGVCGDEDVTINLWVDVFNPVVTVDVKSSRKVHALVSYENWRTSGRVVPQQERSACFSYSGYPGDVITYPDRVNFTDEGVIWYHRNRDDKLLFDYCVKQQGLSAVVDSLVNTQKHRTFGGMIVAKDMRPFQISNDKYIDTPYKCWTLKSQKRSVHHEVKIALHTDQNKDLKEWNHDLENIASKAQRVKMWDRTKEWWHQFWDRSHVFINIDKSDHEDKGWQVGRNYQLFRYQLGCNAYGDYPTKFNGGLFTYDPVFVKQGANLNHGTPDYRSWGGGSFTAQNQRLVYWPMLKSGDFDMMKPQFEFYKRALPNAEMRTKVYWEHDGCSFTEQVENFGLPFAGGWGFDKGPRKRDPKTPFGEQTNPWVKRHFTNQLEFSYMILKDFEYSKHDITEYIPFITSSLTFFFEHYKLKNIERTGQPFDEDNKLVIYPSTACETFKDIKNPTDICAALISVINALQEVPDECLSSDKKEYWKKALEHVPELTYSQHKGKRIIVAGNDLPQRINADIPEMYPVFPYEMYGIGRPNLNVAIDTWNSGILDDRKNYISWHQDAIFCARMGLVDEAKKVTIAKLQDSGRRFPSFWGPGHDWVPDHNWGGSGMIGLQEMLLQCVDNKLFILPTWPNDWNVDFKLHALDKTVVEGLFQEGELKRHTVDSAERKWEIVVNNK